MPAASKPSNESARLESLGLLNVLDSDEEKEFNALVETASLACDMPMSFINLIYTDHQYSKASVGKLGTANVSRDTAFCAHTILQDDLLEINDTTLDPRFSDNPLVTGKDNIRFYAGVTIKLSDGANVGTLCVVDRKPGQLNDNQRAILRQLAIVATFALEQRRMREEESQVRTLSDGSALEVKDLLNTIETQFIMSITDAKGTIIEVNDAFCEISQYSRKELLGKDHRIVNSQFHPKAFFKGMWKTIAAGKPWRADICNRAKDGSFYWVDSVISPVRDTDGKAQRYISIRSDITKRLENERNVEEQEQIIKQIRRMSDGSALEIKDLLNTIETQFIMSITDAKGTIIEVNDAFCEISQYNREELLGKDHRIVNSGYHPSTFFGEMWKTISTGQPWRAEISNRAKDGSIYWVDSVISPVRGANGEIERYISIRSDISARLENESALREQEQLIKQMIESQSVAFFMIDAQHIVVQWNKACEALTGVKAKDIVGKEAWRGFYSESRPCLADLVLDKLTHTAKDYYSTHGASALAKGSWNAESWYDNLGGKRRYVVFDATPLKNVDGKVMGAIQTIHDITKEKLVEQALSEERGSLAAVIEGTKAGAWHWNYVTGECRFNETWAGMLGYSLEELGPQTVDTWKNLLNKNDLLHVTEKLNMHLLGEAEMYEAEFRMAHNDGYWVWVQARGRVLSWTESGEPEWLHGTHTDITKRKNLELDLQQAYHNLDEFTAVASHDLKSPLRGIADLMEWINEDLGTDIPESVEHNLNRVQVRVKRMETLIDDLLQYSRSGKSSEETQLVDPDALLSELSEMQDLPPGFKIKTSGKVQPFITHETPLKTILRNLLSNAVKHHDKKEGTIAINVSQQKEFIVFEVSDDGPGIAKVAQERVFKLFQSLSKKQNGSTGIGLAVSRRMAEAHGGNIELESDVGEGSTFRVLWPRQETRVHTS